MYKYLGFQFINKL